MLNIPSKKKLDESRSKFPLLPQDDYLLEIAELKEEMQENYDKTGEEEAINITFNIVCLKDGSKAVDIEGNLANNRKIWCTIRPNSLGFMQDGTPSKTRAIIAYATGQDIFEDMILEDWQSLSGKTIAAEIIQYLDKQGNKRNKIGRFIAPRLRQAVKLNTDGIPVIEEGDDIDVENIPL